MRTTENLELCAIIYRMVVGWDGANSLIVSRIFYPRVDIVFTRVENVFYNIIINI